MRDSFVAKLASGLTDVRTKHALDETVAVEIVDQGTGSVMATLEG